MATFEKPKEEDPKFQAREELKRRDVQQDLRQFLKLESGLGNSAAFLEGWERHRRPTVLLLIPLKCKHCDFVAEDNKDVDWHKKHANHDDWSTESDK